MGDFQYKAVTKLEEYEFDIKIVNIPFSQKNKPGTVIKMLPNAYTKVKKGRLVTLSVAGHKKNIIVPDFSNISLRNAKIKLLDLSLNLDTIMYEFNPTIKDEYISFQIPTSGSIVKSGSSVTLGVSKGIPPDYFIIPDLINIPLKSARKKIRMEGLRVGSIDYVYRPDVIDKTIIDQSYPPGIKVAIPVKINLTVSKEKNDE